MLFSEIGLGPEVLRAVEDAGYTQPTPIQEQAIPWVLQGRDVLGCAQTGTGKTASFTLPMIDILAQGRARARMPRSLILEPTRELAAQVAENFEVYGKYHKLNMALLIGGESFVDQIKKLDRGVDVLIATPGRMIDLFERGNILLSDIKVFVIDEADRMLDMGFIPDIERIVSLLPRIRQTLFFSATMPPEIRRLADSFLINPRTVSVSPPASTADTVTQAVVLTRAEDKRRALRHLLRTEDVKNALIFCNRKRDVAMLHRSLEKHGFNAGALHGDLPQSKRTETLEAFKKNEITLLVCSDVAARGLDIAGLSHVFNFDVPHSSEDYVHRIGRTGRAGRSGRAFMLAMPDEGKQVAAIVKLINREIPRVEIDGIESVEFEPEGETRRRWGRKEAPKDSERRPPAAESRPARPVEAPVAEAKPARSPEPRGEVNPPRATDPRAADPRAADPRTTDSRPERRRDEPRRRRREDDDDEAVVGFGDHMPAFLLRRARPSRVDGV
ncbi:MAG: DEAD/DEAH box helicase [Azospirillaceae bacterium]|nr:DEAD/DEAH box helicase [Azospirillaceae bacterium]